MYGITKGVESLTPRYVLHLSRYVGVLHINTVIILVHESIITLDSHDFADTCDGA